MNRVVSRSFARIALAPAVCAAALAVQAPSGSARAEVPAAIPPRQASPEMSAEAASKRAVIGPVAGALTALVPLAVGGALLAHDDRPDLQRTATYVILAGFAAAPWVSHAITGRWRRALAFGLGSLGASAGTWVAMRVQDPYDPTIANHDRLTFGALLTTAFFAAAIGVVDSFVFGPVPETPGPAP